MVDFNLFKTTTTTTTSATSRAGLMLLALLITLCAFADSYPIHGRAMRHRTKYTDTNDIDDDFLYARRHRANEYQSSDRYEQHATPTRYSRPNYESDRDSSKLLYDDDNGQAAYSSRATAAASASAVASSRVGEGSIIDGSTLPDHSLASQYNQPARLTHSGSLRESFSRKLHSLRHNPEVRALSSSVVGSLANSAASVATAVNSGSPGSGRQVARELMRKGSMKLLKHVSARDMAKLAKLSTTVAAFVL